MGKFDKWLAQADVPETSRELAIKSFRAARLPSLARAFIGIFAWLFWLIFGWTIPKKAERMPWLLRWADNNISINGDRADWAIAEDGTYYRLPVPMEDRVDENGRHVSYAPGHSPRGWLARYNFNGWRNRAAYLGILWGKVCDPVFTNQWGDKDQSISKMGVQVASSFHDYGGKVFYELRRTSKLFSAFGYTFVNVQHYGYKLLNLNAIDRVAMPTWCPFSVKAVKVAVAPTQ